MTRARSAGDAGFAMYTVLMAMTVILILSASLANGSVATITGVNKDNVETRAFQAAEAGAQTALYRLNLSQPGSGACITTTTAAPQAGTTWCARTTPETIGGGQYFSYQVSVASSASATFAGGAVDQRIPYDVHEDDDGHHDPPGHYAGDGLPDRDHDGHVDGDWNGDGFLDDDPHQPYDVHEDDDGHHDSSDGGSGGHDDDHDGHADGDQNHDGFVDYDGGSAVVPASADGCTGTPYGSSSSERCIVATGTVSGVTRRVILRVVASSGAQPFPVSGVLGLTRVTMSNNASITGSVGTNGTLSMSENTSVSGTANLWTNAPNPSLGSHATISGGVVRGAQFVASPPNMLNPSTGLDSATSNENGRLLSGASPADACTASGGCYTNTAGSPRTLTFSNGKAVTLGGAVYNFCKVNFNNNATINVAAGARVVIFLDSPDRPGSGCVAGQGTFDANNNARFSNPSNDPTAFQLIAYGSAANPNLNWNNNLLFIGTIYAPNSNVNFTNNARLIGGITAKTVTLTNNGSWDSRVGGLRFATTLVYFRGAWRQCPSAPPSPASPATGCR
jgi:type II secretory pathway pseudopilin PulG